MQVCTGTERETCRSAGAPNSTPVPEEKPKGDRNKQNAGVAQETIPVKK